MLKLFWRKPGFLVGMLAAAGLLVSVACGAAEEPTPTPPAVVATPTPTTAMPTPTPAPQPKSGGVLRVAHRADPPDWALWESSTVDVSRFWNPQSNNIVEYDLQDMSIIRPDLAHSWEVSDDGLTYTFHFNEGVKFHDGTAFICGDALKMLEMVRGGTDAGLRRSPRQPALQVINTMECVDDHTLVLGLSQGSASLLAQLAQGWMAVPPAHLWKDERYLSESIGTGPFKLVDYKPGEVIELRRYDGYFKEGLPYLDGVSYQIIRADDARFAALRAGRLDTGDLSGANYLTAQRENPELVLSESPSLGWGSVMPHLEKEPFTDQRVVDAISLAIDRPAFIQAVHEGFAYVGGTLMGRGAWGLPEEMLCQVPGYCGDPEQNKQKARELLAEAGFPNGFDVVMYSRDNVSTQEAVIPLIADLTAVGIRVTNRPEDTAPIFERWTAGDFVLGYHGFAIALDDPDAMFYEHYYCGSDRNYARLCDPEIDDLIDRQSVELDLAERKRLVNLADMKILRSGAKMVVRWSVGLRGFQPYVRGDIPAAHSYSKAFRFEHIWLDK